MNYLKRKISCVLMIAFAAIVANTFPLAVYAQNLVINNCKPVGAVEYKPNGCSTSMRTCCQGGQTSSGLFVLQNWSGWNEDCPELCVEKNPCTSNADCCGGRVCKASSSGGIVRKVCQLASVEDNCLESQKPTCSIANGTCSYICTCSNGKWVNCTKRVVCKSGFILKGSTDSPCCENINCGQTGPNNWQYPCYCATTGEIDYGWMLQTSMASCNMAVYGTDPTTACGQCTASMNGAECTLRPSGSSLPGMDTEWNCKLYMCRLGGGVSWN